MYSSITGDGIVWIFGSDGILFSVGINAASYDGGKSIGVWIDCWG